MTGPELERLIASARALLDRDTLPADLGAVAYRCGALETILRLICDQVSPSAGQRDGAP
jgi:hypothetical protein